MFTMPYAMCIPVGNGIRVETSVSVTAKTLQRKVSHELGLRIRQLLKQVDPRLGADRVLSRLHGLPVSIVLVVSCANTTETHLMAIPKFDLQLTGNVVSPPPRDRSAM